MRRKIGQALRLAGGAAALLTAGGSDAGTLTLGGVAAGLLLAAALLWLGSCLARRRPAARAHFCPVIPLPDEA